MVSLRATKGAKQSRCTTEIASAINPPRNDTFFVSFTIAVGRNKAHAGFAFLIYLQPKSSYRPGYGVDSSPTAFRNGWPSSSSTSAAMPGQAAENEHGLSGRMGLPMTIPPEISVPPE